VRASCRLVMHAHFTFTLHLLRFALPVRISTARLLPGRPLPDAVHTTSIAIDRSERVRPVESVKYRKRRAWCVTLSASIWLILSAAAPALAGDPQRGEPMYQRYCTGCHGVDGRGGGKNFMPHVGALTKKGYTELLKDSYLEAIVAQGGVAFGKSAYMPAFGTTLSSRDIADVIAYVRTFPLY
jgi:cytochrome c553